MQRRQFLKAALGATCLPLVPASAEPRQLCDVCAIGEGCGAMYLVDNECPEDLEMAEKMKPLDDLYLRLYGG